MTSNQHTQHTQNAQQLHSSPSWVKQAVVYQIFPDRFYKDPAGIRHLEHHHLDPWGAKPRRSNFCGGNLQGIIRKLDYIQDMGFNTLYLCPIFSSVANHRYHTLDYFQIDPLLGTMDDFEELTQALHQRGMRIVLDGVFNHASRGFYAFNSLMETGENSPWKDWFHVHSFPVKAYGRGAPNYDCWWGIPDLPKFNTDHPPVREYLWEVAEFWTRKGVDGWRLDVPNEIDDDEFWREFRRRVRGINADAWIVGEIWEEPDRWIQGDQFDGVMNYTVRQALVDYFFPGEDERNHGRRVDVAELAQELESRLSIPQIPWMMNLPGSHDTRRITTLAGKRKTRLKALWAFYFVMPGAPCVYYGDEIGLRGGKDPGCRACFPWGEHDQDKELQEFFKKGLRLRNNRKELQEGDCKVRISGDWLLLERTSEGVCTALWLNSADTAASAALPKNAEVHYSAKTRGLHDFIICSYNKV